MVFNTLVSPPKSILVTATSTDYRMKRLKKKNPKHVKNSVHKGPARLDST